MTNEISFAALPDFALLEVRGPDSERFLQGQLTCDVVTLNDLHWTLGACCTPKGRMIANFVIARRGDSFWLRLPKSQVSVLKTHLQKYAVFFKAELIEHEEGWQIIGSQIDTTEPKLLETALPVEETEQGISLHWPDGRIEQWLSVPQSGLAIHKSWRAQDIMQGLAWVKESTTEHWIPQNIDWHQQGGVSFSKGCYTGQEIVARLQYLGKSKKSLVAINSDEPLDISVLDNLTNAEGKNVGEVVSWNKQLGLAFINQDEEGPLTVNEQTVVVSQLFYADHSEK